MTPDAVINALNRLVTADEVRRELERVITPDEREDVLALVRWFTGRYRSAPERLAYVRQASARWRPRRETRRRPTRR